MFSRRLRRTLAIAALTAVFAILPLSDLSAGVRNESRWERPEPVAQRVVRQVSSFWNLLLGLLQEGGESGLRIDGNG